MQVITRNLVVLGTVLTVLAACAKSSTPLCDCDNAPLPTPEKVVRSRLGFTPVKIEASIDFSTGQVAYSRDNQIDDSDSCEGSVSIQDQVESWKEASRIAVCFGEVEKPVTDGTLDSVTLYYPASTSLPEGLETRVDGEWITVKLYEKLNDSLQGRQQFDCSGSFALDALIAEKASCLKVD